MRLIISCFVNLCLFLLNVKLCELAYNGPAVEGVNVTRRSIRTESRYFSQKTVTVQGGYGAIFARPTGGQPGGQIPAKDKIVPMAGFVQSRNHGFDR
jgi:hypothetical protein